MSIPAFYKYTSAEITGVLPLKDIFGRVLRAAAPYSMNCQIKISNKPTPLDPEIPPPPSASGEETTVESIIGFW